MNVIDAIRHHSRMRPYDLAVVHPSGAANYAQLAAIISAVAARLRSQAVQPGMSAAVYVSDPFLHLVLVLAMMHNGTVSISAHPNYDAIPAEAGIDVLLADKTLPFATPARVIPVAANWLQADEATATQPLLDGVGFPDGTAVCRMYTSSGTTGVAKVIAHTADNLHAMAVANVLTEPLSSGPNLSMMWFSTIGGFGTTQYSLWHGSTLVLATAPLMILRAINLYRVAFLRASPQQLQGLVQMVRGRSVRFPSLERIEVGGASTPQSVVLGARATLCTNVVGVYGSTEASLVAQTPASVLSTQPDAAGYVVPGAQVRIVDDMDNPVAAGVEGIVQIRTPYMATAYVGDPAATAAAFRGGWFIPGDLGVLGADGLLHIRGRTDEMINAGGVKLSPAMVDEFLLAQPGVRDAAAFAFRQTGHHDQVWAAVVATEEFDEKSLLAAARAKLNSRAPVRLIRVAEIPRNAMGKPLRQKLSQDALMM